MSLMSQRRGSQPAPPWGRAQSSPMALPCPKSSLPTSPGGVFPTREAHPGTSQAPQRSAELHPSCCSLSGMDKPHPPHWHIQSPAAAGIWQDKTQFLTALSAESSQVCSSSSFTLCAPFPGRSRVPSDDSGVPRSSLCCTAWSPLRRSSLTPRREKRGIHLMPVLPMPSPQNSLLKVNCEQNHGLSLIIPSQRKQRHQHFSAVQFSLFHEGGKIHFQ